MPKPTQEEIERCRSTEEDDRTLSVHVTTQLMRRVEMEIADRQISKTDFIIESVLKNSRERA